MDNFSQRIVTVVLTPPKNDPKSQENNVYIDIFNNLFKESVFIAKKKKLILTFIFLGSRHLEQLRLS